MQFRTIAVLLLLAAIAVFALLNWGAIMAPTTLSLAFTTVQAPLGLVMLGLVALVTIVFLAFVVYLQSSVLLETRRQARELQNQRNLADQAEASRFTELRSHVDAQFGKLAQQSSDSREQIWARLQAIESNVRTAFEQTGNSLAAQIGELEDRLERGALK